MILSVLRATFLIGYPAVCADCALGDVEMFSSQFTWQLQHILRKEGLSLLLLLSLFRSSPWL